MASEDYRGAEVTAITILDDMRRKSGSIRDEDVETVLTLVLSLPPYQGLSKEEIRRRVERRRNVMVSAPLLLEDATDHTPWLRERRGHVDWRFWSRYRRYLLGGTPKPWPIESVSALDQSTDLALELIEDPTVSGRQFDRRGMVVGQVQSGKTANFTGLICKAVDAGYKVVVVLAGPFDNLRSQTQMRLDEEFIGYDTAQFYRASQLADNAASGRIGVGDPRILPGEAWLPSQSLTTRNPDGDFRMATASAMVADLGNIPTLLVVKKNASVLNNLVTYLRESPRAQFDAATNHAVLHDIPLLVIDDECDYASVNTRKVGEDNQGERKDDYNPSTINRLIRELLTSFSQKAYVGYTATPFANIFIHSEDYHRQYGADLFPRSFILTLPVPSDYIGPEQVFGTVEAPGPYRQLVKTVTDSAGFIEDGHDLTFEPGPIPPSLREAIRSFVIATAARRARGQRTVHNSLLIHVTRFQEVQHRVYDLVETELRDIRNELTYGKGSASATLRQELHRLWEREFAPVSLRLGKMEPGDGWETIDAELLPSVDKMRMKLINGQSDDLLEYHDRRREGVNVIVIGGDKLSRGLTLEGLTVSYYLRASRMYDTLMQMGRWFGYRSGYEDLCRIYTTKELQDWYTAIASAAVELTEEFEAMVTRGATPETYGLRVKSHPDLMITSQVKMRNGETLLISYEGTISESTVFAFDNGTLRRNLDLTDAFVRNLGAASLPESVDRGHQWNKVDGDRVANFLEGFSTHERAPRANGRRLAEYVRNQIAEGELTQWTVYLASRPAAGDSGSSDDEGGATAPHGSEGDPVTPFEIGGQRINLTHRKPNSYQRDSHFSVRRVVSPSHESRDLTSEEEGEAVRLTADFRRAAGRSTPGGDAGAGQLSGKAIRLSRPKIRGLLILYPLDPTCIQKRIRGLDSGESEYVPDPSFSLVLPPIGFAVSFPGSPTAAKVAYKVNNVYWDQEYAAP